MAMITQKELEAKIRDAKANSKEVTLGCGAGVVLQVKSTGSCIFFARYKENDKYKKVKIGGYPKLTLESARKKAQEYIKKVDKSKSEAPVMLPLFKDVKEAFLADKKTVLSSARVANIKTLCKHLSILDKYRLNELTMPCIENELQAYDTSDHNKFEMLKLFKQIFSSSMYKVDTNNSLLLANMTRVLEAYIRSTDNKFKKPAVKGYTWCKAEKLKDLFFSKLDCVNELIRCYYLFVALTASRKGEIRVLKWSWINFNKDNELKLENGYVKIPKEYTKTKHEDHIIPLTAQMLKLLYHVKSLRLSEEYVFSSGKAPICETYIGDPIRATGASNNCSLHGLRKAYSTFMNESVLNTHFDRLMIEESMSHKTQSSIGATYNKYGYYQEIKQLFDYWNDYLVKNQITPAYQELLN